jgi:hypothetical protein
MTKTQVEVITSVERRRRWSRAENERIVAAAMEPGAVASAGGDGAERRLSKRISRLGLRRPVHSRALPIFWHYVRYRTDIFLAKALLPMPITPFLNGEHFDAETNRLPRRSRIDRCIRPGFRALILI